MDLARLQTAEQEASAIQAAQAQAARDQEKMLADMLMEQFKQQQQNQRAEMAANSRVEAARIAAGEGKGGGEPSSALQELYSSADAILKGGSTDARFNGDISRAFGLGANVGRGVNAVLAPFNIVPADEIEAAQIEIQRGNASITQALTQMYQEGRPSVTALNLVKDSLADISINTTQEAAYQKYLSAQRGLAGLLENALVTANTLRNPGEGIKRGTAAQIAEAEGNARRLIFASSLINDAVNKLGSALGKPVQQGAGGSGATTENEQLAGMSNFLMGGQ
jgi:hypothetical protein